MGKNNIFASNLRSYFVEQFSLHFIATHYLEIRKKRKRMTFASDTKSYKIQLQTQDQN